MRNVVRSTAVAEGGGVTRALNCCRICALRSRFVVLHVVFICAANISFYQKKPPMGSRRRWITIS